MRILFPMMIMLIAGLALGGGSMTLYWSSVVDRGFSTQAQWKNIADQFRGASLKNQSNSDRFEAIARKNQAGWTECLAFVKAR